ncbi:hypothetical protein ACFTZD_21095, partial [Streptomyces sp. NPDC057083]
ATRWQAYTRPVGKLVPVDRRRLQEVLERPPASSNRVGFRGTTIPDAIAQASQSGWAINRWGSSDCQHPARRNRQPAVAG